MYTTRTVLNDNLWRREMPEPLAELYGSLRAGTPEQQFDRITQLGEFAVHFCAVVALANAAAGSTTPAAYAAWARSLLPLTLGNSLRILYEAVEFEGAGFCPELRPWLADPSTAAALKRLRTDRNADSHGGGAAGRQATVKAGEELAAQLLPALKGLEFLADYSLGYLVSCEARRGGGWKGQWHGLRGDQRSDDDGPIAGRAGAPPLCHEILLVQPSGARGLSLSPLLAVVAFAKRDRLAMLRRLPNGYESTHGLYARPSELADEESQALDTDQPTAWSAYGQAPRRWHGLRNLELDAEALHKVFGVGGRSVPSSRLRLGVPAGGPRGQRGWVAENLEDNGTVLAFPLAARLSENAQLRAATVDRLRSLTEPGMPRFLSLERGDQGYLLTFEHVGGQSLTRWLDEQGRLDPVDAARLLVGPLEALAEAHRAGLWHGAVNPEGLVVSPSGRLRLVQPLLPPDDAADATTRHSLQVLDALSAPQLVSDQALDVAGAATVLAQLCGVAFRLGQRPPDIAYQAAATPRPLALWFDRAARRSPSVAPFVDAGAALEALRQGLAQHGAIERPVSMPVGGGPVPARSPSGRIPVDSQATQPAPEVDWPSTRASAAPNHSPSGTPSAGDRDAAATAVRSPAVPAPSPARSRSGLLLTLVFATVAATAAALYLAKPTFQGPVQADDLPSQRQLRTQERRPEHAPSAAPEDAGTLKWDAFIGYLPRAGLVDQLQGQAGPPTLRELLQLPAERVDELTKAVAKSDVRPDLVIRKFVAPSGDKSSFILAERDDRQLQRLGTWFSPRSDATCAELAAPLPPATATWRLDCGGEMRWYALEGMALHYYVPPGTGKCEWWLTQSDASANPIERQIANAYSCNDAAEAAWEAKDARLSLTRFRQALEILPGYPKAAGRACVVAHFLGETAQDLCDLAATSNFEEMRACVRGLPRDIKLGAKLCP